jgi:activator of 2-hydroxyglutaryl-CoA dehydratase
MKLARSLRSFTGLKSLANTRNYVQPSIQRENNNDQKFKRNTSFISAGLFCALGGAVFYHLTQKKYEKDELPVILAEEHTKDKVPIYKIVLTGGPCGGKSSAMTRLR